MISLHETVLEGSGAKPLLDCPLAGCSTHDLWDLANKVVLSDVTAIVLVEELPFKVLRRPEERTKGGDSAGMKRMRSRSLTLRSRLVSCLLDVEKGLRMNKLVSSFDELIEAFGRLRILAELERVVSEDRNDRSQFPLE